MGRVDTETENADGHKRFLARTSTTHCRGRTGPNGDERVDGRKLSTRTVHKEQLNGTRGGTDADGLHQGAEETGSKTNSSGRLRLVQDGSHGSFLCYFTEIPLAISEMCSENGRMENIRGKKLLPRRQQTGEIGMC